MISEVILILAFLRSDVKFSTTYVIGNPFLLASWHNLAAGFLVSYQGWGAAFFGMGFFTFG